MDITIFRREPAAWLAFVAVVVKLISAFWLNVSDDQQAMINAVAAALVGVIVAFMTHDGVAAAVYGFAQAALALAVGFGLSWSADQQAVALSAVSVILALFVRTQVTAKVPPAIPASLRRGVYVTAYDDGPKTGNQE
ncbi:MAG: hypothetical protein EPO09_21555 [Aquabacterium sp.]|uniref:hypothetical protein n=1 Tax=Aquabacterium sp. TaxID=1872578 RepID=UPI00120B7FAD|nr:hypothetical protein [Aquabacterium sp.]TAK82632.1 MAG: hypothetical protein EPO09_21555 [Aquabacterium sp.]